MKLFDHAHTLLFAYQMCVKLQQKPENFPAVSSPSPCLTAGGVLDFEIAVPPQAFLGKKGLLPLSATSLLHCCSITFQSSPGAVPEGSCRQAAGHKGSLTQVSARSKARVLLLCTSYFFLSCANTQGGFFQVKWNNSNITLRSQHKFIFLKC